MEAEGGADARAGGQATAPPSSPRCLSATTPPPARRRLTGTPVMSRRTDGRTDGRATYAAALTDHRRWTAHEDDAAARLFATNIMQLLTLNFERSRNIVVKISQENQSPENATIDALVAAQPLSRGGGRRQ